MTLKPPTLQQQAARIVLLKGRPTNELPPKDLRQNLEALAQIPGIYTVTQSLIKAAQWDAEMGALERDAKMGVLMKRVRKVETVRQQVLPFTSGRGNEWQGLRVAGPSKYANMCPPGGHPTMPNSIHGIPNTSLVSVKHRLLRCLNHC